MPLGRAGVGHGLDLLVLGRKRLDQTKRLVADRGETLGPMPRWSPIKDRGR